MPDIIPVLVLIARPAGGKSEIIAYLNSVADDERGRRFHIGRMHRIDDFPMLWTWFEEDRILSELGHARLHTDSDGYFKEHYLWDVLMRRISLEYSKLQRDLREEPQPHTVVIEFSRGKEHGGFRRAFEHLSDEILENAAIVYIDVSYEESVRKNQARFNPEKPDSILEHGLPVDKMEVLYKESDWDELVAETADGSGANGPQSGVLQLRGHHIPYAVFENRDDVTTDGGEVLGRRLEETIRRLIAVT